MVIEEHKISPLDNPNPIPIDRKILSHHIFLQNVSVKKDFNLVASCCNDKVGKEKNELRAPNFNLKLHIHYLKLALFTVTAFMSCSFRPIFLKTKLSFILWVAERQQKFLRAWLGRNRILVIGLIIYAVILMKLEASIPSILTTVLCSVIHAWGV